MTSFIRRYTERERDRIRCGSEPTEKISTKNPFFSLVNAIRRGDSESGAQKLEMESARIVVNGWREGKKMAQMTSIQSETAREFHGRTRHGVLSIECALRNQVSLALWIRNGQGHVPTQQQQQLYYDIMMAVQFSLPSPSTNEKGERTGQQCRKLISSSSTSSFFEP